MRELRFNDALGWWQADPDDRPPYRANRPGVFFAQKNSVVGLDLRKAKAPESEVLARTTTFICDGAATTRLPALVPRAGADWGLRLEGRWGPEVEKAVPEPGPVTLSAKGAQACKAALRLAAQRQPKALALDTVDDVALASLGAQPQLRVLRIWYTNVTDKGLQTVSGFRGLTELNAGNNAGISDDGIAQLAALPALAAINLEQTALGERGLAALAGIRGLQRLIINATKITDEALRALREHPSLVQVGLSSTTISDAGMEHLATIPTLQSVSAWGTKVKAVASYPFLSR